MLLAEIEAVVAVARLGSLRRAGEHLHLSEPAVSARVRNLETELSAPLFERRREGMVLTTTGRAFVSYAERILATVDSAARAVRDLSTGHAGELVLAAAPSVSAYVIPELVPRVRAAYPGIRVTVRTGHAADVLEMVTRKDAQLGIVAESPGMSRGATRLYDEELVLVALPGHPLGATRVAPTDLARVPLVLFDRASRYHALTRGFLASYDVEPDGIIEVDSIETARRMVSRGAGVALLPTTGVAESLARGDLVQIGLHGVPPIRLSMVAVESGADRLWPPVVAVRELLRSVPDFVAGALPPA